jgi:hypothetical protein
LSRFTSSNFWTSPPPSYTFSEIERGCLGAKRLGMIFFRNFEGIFEIQKQSAVGNAEVRTNLFEKIPNPVLSVPFFWPELWTPEIFNIIFI